MRVALKTLGCRVNEAELERWSRDFRAAGHSIVGPSAEVDLIVLNSCAVTHEAVRKSRTLLRRMHRENPRAKLVLSGCYATLSGAEAASLGVDLVVRNEDKDRLVEIVQQELNPEDMPALATDPEAGSPLPSSRQRAFVKVQDGCRYRCTFCIVTVARGNERSRPVEEIIGEINSLAERGTREVVLTGVHLGGYGSDLGSTLDRLIRAILAETNIHRLRLGSLEPWDLPDSFFELFQDERMMPHLHLPLQSGSDEILKRMARRCKTAEFARLVADARAAVSDLNITTDIIVGFPGENDEEWSRSLAFIEEMAFGHIHIFTYSPRAGTKAVTLPSPVPPAVKKTRSAALHLLAESGKEEFQRSFLGRCFPILVEGGGRDRNDGERVSLGYTPNYMRVEAGSPTNRINQILAVRLTRFDDSRGCLVGQFADA